MHNIIKFVIVTSNCLWTMESIPQNTCDTEQSLIIFQERITAKETKYSMVYKYVQNIRCLKFVDTLLSLTASDSVNVFYFLKKSADETRSSHTSQIESRFLRKILVISAIKDVLFWIKDGGHRIDRTIDVYGFAAPILENILGLSWNPQVMKNQWEEYIIFIKTIKHNREAVEQEESTLIKKIQEYGENFYQDKNEVMNPIIQYEGNENLDAVIEFFENQYEKIFFYDFMDLYFISCYADINEKPIPHYLYNVTENLSKIIAILRFQKAYNQWLQHHNIYELPLDALENVKNDFIFVNYPGELNNINGFNNEFITTIIQTYKKSYDKLCEIILLKTTMNDLKKLKIDMEQEYKKIINGEMIKCRQSMDEFFKNRMMNQKDHKLSNINGPMAENIFKSLMVLLKQQRKILNHQEVIIIKDQLSRGVNLYKILLSLNLSSAVVSEIVKQLSNLID